MSETPPPPAQAPAPEGALPVSVLISVYNSEATLGAQLAALAEQTYLGPWELLVNDNGSTDASLAVARHWAGIIPQLRVVDASQRQGDPCARNIGAEHAGGLVLAFCDSDDVVDRDWLRSIVAAMDGHDMVVGACDLRAGGDMGNPADAPGTSLRARLDGGYDFLPFGVSANVALSAAAYRTLGGFCEDYQLGHDVDLCWRAQLTGLRFGYAPGAVVYKRARSTLAGAWQQHYAYGLGDVLLFTRFRRQGMPRNLRRAVRLYGWLLVNVVGLGRPDVRATWVRACGKCCGRLVGSVRWRTLYL